MSFARIQSWFSIKPYSLISAVFAALASRIFVILNAFLVNCFLPIINPNAWGTGLPILHLFARWDAGHYFKIASTGYDKTNIGFFPLYPLLMKIIAAPLKPIMPESWALNIAGFSISNFFFFIAVIGIYRLTYTVSKDEATAYYSTVFLSFYPTSVFFSAVYAESLTIALMLWGFLMLENGKLYRSSLLIFLAGLARPIGFLASIPLFIDGLEKKSMKGIMLAIVSVSSILLFDVYRYMITSRFYALSMLQGIFHRSPSMITTMGLTKINMALKVLTPLTMFGRCYLLLELS